LKRNAAEDGDVASPKRVKLEVEKPGGAANLAVDRLYIQYVVRGGFGQGSSRRQRSPTRCQMISASRLESERSHWQT